MLTVDGIPAHPLVVHAVVVLLPLAAVGTLLVAARPVWRRQLGVWVLLLALAGVAAVPVAQLTGAQLAASFGDDAGPLVAVHVRRAGTLLVPALVFLALLAASVALGRRADVVATGADALYAATGRTQTRTATRTAASTASLRRLAAICGALAALAGIVVTGLVVWIGHAGSAAAWSG